MLVFPEPFFYIITISSLVSLLYYSKFKNTKYIYFLHFIYFTFAVDVTCYLNRLFSFIISDGFFNNNPILNIYIISTFLFFIAFYKSIFKNKFNKQIATIFLWIYGMFIIVDFAVFKTNFVSNLLTKTTVFGSILFLILLILFLIEIIKNERIIFNIEKSFVFWISIGCLLFYIGIIPIFISSEQFFKKELFDTILNILNTVAHVCFIVGYMYSDKKYNY